MIWSAGETKINKLRSIAIIAITALNPLFFSNVRMAYASYGCAVNQGATLFSACPIGNQWAPYGPFVKNLQFKFYPSVNSEVTDFMAGLVDLGDSPLPKTDYLSFSTNPDFLVPPIVSGAAAGIDAYYGVSFNGASNRFTDTGFYGGLAEQNQGPYWVCDWNQGTPGTSSRLTYVTACGIEMRQGFAHLIDRPALTDPSFGVLPINAVPLADPSPPVLVPSGSTLGEQCSWDLFNAVTNPNGLGERTINGHTYPVICLSAYNFVVDPSGFAGPGSLDFCAAAQHMINAHIADDMNTDCTLGGHIIIPGGIATLLANPLRFMIRNDDPSLLFLANGPCVFFACGGLINAIDLLFGGPGGAGVAVVAPTYGSIQTLGPIVFDEYPEGSTSDWDMFTYANYLPGLTVPSHLYDMYSTEGASDLCGGPDNPAPDNPTFVCLGAIQTGSPTCPYSPTTTCTFEDDVVAALQTTSFPASTGATLSAFREYGKRAVDIPVFAPRESSFALRSVAGVINERALGYSNFWTALNGRNDTSYTSVNPIYSFGGGDATTLRWGEPTGTSELNVFNARSPTELNVLGEVYDTLFRSSPVQPGNVICWMCNVDPSLGFNGPTRVIDVSGNAHFMIELKNTLYWQDGVKVDAYDVAFSLLALRDYAESDSTGFGVQSLKSVTVFPIDCPPDIIIAGITPDRGTILKTDSLMKFVNSTNTDHKWAPGKAVVYDTNSNDVYDVGEPVISGSPTVGQKLVLDSLIKFVDSNSNGHWDSGESVIYDADGGGWYGSDCLTGGLLDIVFNGNSVLYPMDLARAFIIPRHIWECTSDSTCAASTHPTKHNDYLAAGVLEPSITKRSIDYDPITNRAFIGSGPFACVSRSGSDVGAIGSGCARDAAGTRYDSQNIPVYGTMLLQSYDFVKNTGAPSSFYQYMRSVDGNWSTGSGNTPATHSGQFNEFSWVDYNENGQVDITDAQNLGFCVGASSSATSSPLCQSETGTRGGVHYTNGYDYWHINAFESTPGVIGSGELSILQTHFGDNYVAPFSWTPTSLRLIVPYP